jgi:hypothetical protein
MAHHPSDVFDAGDRYERRGEKPGDISDGEAWILTSELEPSEPDRSGVVTGQEAALERPPGPDTVQVARREVVQADKSDVNANDDDGDDPPESDGRPEVTAEEAEEKFKDTLHGVRLVYDFGSNEVVGIATWDADDWAWRIVSRESSAERKARQVGINLFTDLAAQLTGLITAPATNLDKAVSIASLAANPQALALKLCNGAVQVLAYHFVPGYMASALGSLAEQILAPAVDPPNRLSGVMRGLQAFDVTVDVATDQLTAAVQDFAAAESDAMLQKKTQGISQAELDEIEEAIRQRQAAQS